MMVGGHIDAAELLSASLPHRVPERVVEIASAQARCPVAVYVLDLEGSFALCLAGDVVRFPQLIRATVGVGPEIIPEALPQLRALVIDLVGPSTLWPMVVRDRVMGFLLVRGRPACDLEAFAGQAALALELASGYTDVLHTVRRRKDTRPAAEIQQNLLPPRLSRVSGAMSPGACCPAMTSAATSLTTPATRTAYGWSSPTRPARATRPRRFRRLRSARCAQPAAPALGCKRPRGWPRTRSWRWTSSVI